jgi:glyoxylase-like metal-dependent hydrolase (beta-lactamase superfamily II)
LVFSEGEAAIIDPGGEADDILLFVREKNLKVKYIINTHHHPDHTFANKLVKEETKAKILIHEAAKEYINFKPGKFLKDNEEIKIGDTVLKVIHVPGHTKDSICLLGDGFVFTGDLLFKDGIGRTDLIGGSAREMKKSLKKILKILKPGTKVYPGHGGSFKIKEKELNLEKVKNL